MERPGGETRRRDQEERPGGDTNTRKEEKATIHYAQLEKLYINTNQLFPMTWWKNSGISRFKLNTESSVKR